MNQGNGTFCFNGFLFNKPELTGFNGEAYFPYIFAVIFKLPGYGLKLFELCGLYFVYILSVGIDLIEFFLEEHTL